MRYGQAIEQLTQYGKVIARGTWPKEKRMYPTAFRGRRIVGIVGDFGEHHCPTSEDCFATDWYAVCDVSETDLGPPEHMR